MLQFLLVLDLLFVQLAMITSDESLYPDVSCHPTYDRTPYGEEAGEGWVLDSMEVCKKPQFYHRADGCYKECVFQRHGILEFLYPTPEETQQMGSDMFNGMFEDEQIGSKIANKIVSECSEKLKAANEKKIPCEDREEFYTCVETAWSC